VWKATFTAAAALGLAAAGAPAVAQEAAATPTVEYLGENDGGLPFSEAVRVGHMLYLAGQVATGPDGALVEGGIRAEARQVMENIRAVLERHGSSLDRVVKCTVMIDDIAEWGAFNEVYVEFFPGPKPARSAFGADGLALGAAVEVECWATVG
jgi:2-iminobutanoate/2-iminopropanoate deaminase